jgi:hypothetical protein
MSSKEIVIPDKIKKRFDREVAKAGYQQMVTELDALVFNEDNIPEIAKTLIKVHSVKSLINNTHESGKAKALAECNAYDAAKRDSIKLIDDVLIPKRAQYAALCQSVEQKKKDQAAENLRIETIKKGIEGNVVFFSDKITEAATIDDLVNVFELVNLEMENTKYAEFLPEAATAFNKLLPLLTQKKAQLKNLASAKTDKSQAKIQGAIEETGMLVQEAAVEAATSIKVENAQVILPDVKIKRKTWKYKAVDISQTLKENPAWVTVEINNEVVNEYLKSEKAKGIPEGKEEFTVSGIKFYLHKEY